MAWVDPKATRKTGRTSGAYFWGHYVVAGSLLAAGVLLLPDSGSWRHAGAGAQLAPWLLTAGALVMARALAIVIFGMRWWLTNDEIVHSDGVVSRHTQELRLEDVGEVEVRQGWIARLLGVGSVRVAARDSEATPVVLEGVRQPREVASAIESARSEDAPTD